MPLSGSLNVDSMVMPEPSCFILVSRLPGASVEGWFLSSAHLPAKPSSLLPALPGVTKAAKKAKGARPDKAVKEKGVREGSKTETILALLKRTGGVTAKELMEATGWQPHSVRGFLSGTIGKKMGLTVTSTKGEDGERSYSIKP